MNHSFYRIALATLLVLTIATTFFQGSLDLHLSFLAMTRAGAALNDAQAVEIYLQLARGLAFLIVCTLLAGFGLYTLLLRHSDHQPIRRRNRPQHAHMLGGPAR